ncbi:hypothetical protein L3Q82_008129 [Scortum barcoo]|uniref:Uncharacterized protein n=1 Tax=Scortum barcoo TaxID=214431 RepID=A0ACB8WGC3_9TELE|nr:hypothetical protein L3Q82_008129 [Scortum barcoo]
MNSEHDYSTLMETANASTNKRDRMSTTPANTPEKSHTEKKAKGTPQETDSNTSADTILKAIDTLGNTLGKRVDDCMVDVGTQMQQHSTMLAAVAKAVQLNSEELEECKMKIKYLKKQIESLTKDNDDIKGRLLNQERYKRKKGENE